MTGKTNNFSLAARANIATASEKGCFLHVGAADGSDGYSIGVGGTTFDDNGNNLIFELCPNQWLALGAIGGTGWKHLAVTVDGSGIIHGWVDGSEVGSAELWTPAALGTDLLVWLDARDSSTITVTGSGVSTWADKSGNALDATQTTDGNRPAYANNVVTFASLDGLNTEAGYPSNYDYILAVKSDSSTTQYRNWFLGAGASAVPLLGEGGTNNLGTWITNFAQFGSLTLGASTEAILYGSVPSATVAKLALNGGAFADSTKTFGATDGRIVQLGRTAFSQAPGDIYELVLVTVGRTTADQQKLEGYIAHKWNLASLLPGDHPYKTSLPLVT